MAISLLGPRLVQQVVAELDAGLGSQIEWLRSSQRLAFGDNPRHTLELEEELNTLIARLERLRLHFEHGVAERQAIMLYRAARENLYLAVEYVETVRALDRGSTVYTQKLLTLLSTARLELVQLGSLEPHMYSAAVVG